MLIELIRNKNNLPFDYYKEILLNYRKIISELDIQTIQEYSIRNHAIEGNEESGILVENNYLI